MANAAQTFSHKLEATHWTKAIQAAFIAGVTFLVLQTLIAAFIHGTSPWLPLRMIAAIALGTGVLPETGLSLGVILTAFFVHFGLSLMSAWILAPIIQGTPLNRALVIGAVFGLIIYLVNFYVLTAGFSWFAGMRGWATLLNHLIFGAVMAWAYEHRRMRD